MRKLKKVMVVLLAVAMVASLAGCGGGDAAEEKVKVGFIYIGPPGDAGWTYAHDEGRKFLESEMPNVEVVFVESVPESSDSERVMTELAEQDCDIIFATSFGYMDFMLNVAEKYPDKVFYHCSGYKTADNMSNYFGRIYQARYLTGLVAGAMTQNGQIGYVAAHPIPEVVRGINAFTVGVREANPNAVVKVVWTNTWYDPAKEKDAAQGLLDAGVDVIAQHQDTPGPQQAAEEAGKYAIGYNTDMRSFAPKANLTSAVWDWGPYYVEAVKAVVDGTYTSGSYWGGLEDGIVDIAPLSDEVPAEVADMVEAKKQEMINGEWDVFWGPIKDQSGTVVVPEGSKMEDGELLSFDWFVEGVEGVIPK